MLNTLKTTENDDRTGALLLELQSAAENSQELSRELSDPSASPTTQLELLSEFLECGRDARRAGEELLLLRRATLLALPDAGGSGTTPDIPGRELVGRSAEALLSMDPEALLGEGKALLSTMSECRTWAREVRAPSRAEAFLYLDILEASDALRQAFLERSVVLHTRELERQAREAHD